MDPDQKPGGLTQIDRVAVDLDHASRPDGIPHAYDHTIDDRQTPFLVDEDGIHLWQRILQWHVACAWRQPRG
jgi:hypothetical protein